jgi:hypothetical protein
MNKKKDYLKEEINEFETKRKNKNIRVKLAVKQTA